MNAFQLSLRALKHPLSLASIGVLLLNDHLLKAVAPSVLTGKLSDFAGLFFFPFLLTAVLSLPFDRLRMLPRRTAALGFGLTLCWFALIKVSPEVNSLTIAVVSRMLGLPVRSVSDPTDLFALIILWPAWRMWLSLERAPQPQAPGKAAYLALGMASLAALATSPCLPQARVVRLVVYEQKVYAGLSYDYASQFSSIPVSSDGINWETVDLKTVPEGVLPKLKEPVAMPVTACEPQNPQVCYRVAGAEQIDGSTDGGQTWRAVWNTPWGRREFMLRYLQSGFLSCKNTVDLGPYDLALLTQNGATTVIAAAGNEGLLIRTLDGAWERYQAMNAIPTPYVGGSLLFILLGETGFTLVAGLIVWIALSIWGGKAILARARLPEGRSTGWATNPAWAGIGVLILIGGLMVLMFSTGSLNEGFLFILFAAAVVSIFGGPALTWSRVVSLSAQPELARRAGWACTLAAVGVFPLAWLPLVAWVYGLIPLYALALGIGLAIGAASLFAGITGIKRAMRLMAGTPEVDHPNAPLSDGIPKTTAAPRGQPGVLVVLVILAAMFPPQASSIWRWLAFLSNSPDWFRIVFQIILLGLLGLAGLWFCRKLDLPGIFSGEAAHPGGLIGLLLRGLFLGGGFSILTWLVARDFRSSSGLEQVSGWLQTLSGAIGDEIIFRMFLLSVLALMLAPRLQQWREGRAGLETANLIATLVFALAGIPLFYIFLSGAPWVFRWFVLVEFAFKLAVGWIAGKRFIRDGLVGAVCIGLGSGIGWGLGLWLMQTLF